MVFNTGMMAPITKDNGVTTKQRVKERSGRLKVMFTMESSKMIWRMDMENILILMDQNIKGNSKMMSKKDMEKKSG